MSGVATAVIGSSVLGGIVSSNAASQAASAQRSAANQANATQLSMFNQQRQDLEPWRNAGSDALGQIQSQQGDFQRDFNMQDFQADPGYAFRLAEGQKAIERSAAARGGLASGQTMKSLENYAQGVASQEYQNAYNRFNSDRDRRFNRLSSVAGIGQTANSQMGAAGQNYANNVSQNQIGVGNANAAAAMAPANALNSAIGTGANTWMQYQLMNRIMPTK